jgi:2,3-bisphosphoglycerate-dependent phosphoglycerate mutase
MENSKVPEQRWPKRLWLVRHGESAGNVASGIAHSWGELKVDVAQRDVDVPLSPTGVEQSRALGRWFAAFATEERPDVAITSPYLRARQTAALIRETGGLAQDTSEPLQDERLREREFGILDRLTPSGVRELHPEQAELRRVIGKFYHRPPGGESWCDVILRLRSVLDTLSLHYAGQRVLIVAHEVVVLCFRYLIENLDERRILAIDQEGDVVNCGVTEYECGPEKGPGGSRMHLRRYNFSAPLREGGAAVTSAKDLSYAPR